MFSPNRTKELLYEALGWIYEHTRGFGEDEFIRALTHMGLTSEEIRHVLVKFE